MERVYLTLVINGKLQRVAELPITKEEAIDLIGGWRWLLQAAVDVEVRRGDKRSGDGAE